MQECAVFRTAGVLQGAAGLLVKKGGNNIDGGLVATLQADERTIHDGAEQEAESWQMGWNNPIAQPRAI